MKTVLADFCLAYANRVAPLAGALRDALRRTDSVPGAEPLGDARLQLAEAQHRLKLLADKLAGQQTYLVIFGPLKSGKSTLMNAISGAYVSEVSSLPAYPCLVYVQNGDAHGCSVTTYEGRSRHVDSVAELNLLVEQEHRRLAARLREVEDAGESFDPVTHLPHALRRIDVTLPASELSRSGVVLVDTPGLYTRMKFGYDVMTRDFRDTAACAVFVVKTENLFLEQVFTEFNALLDTFSRVFLVVNIDAGKKDLAPDGTLRPSAESAAPQQVVEAFESLSMDAPLRRAYEEGRLDIYAIDALGTASARLQRAASLQEGHAVEELPEAEAGEAGEKEAAEAAEGVVAPDSEGTLEVETSFDRFLGDLGGYLNSSDYLVAFRRDSIQQGDAVAAALRVATVGTAVPRLEEARRGHQTTRDASAQLLEAAEQVAGLDWDAALAETARRVADASGRLCADEVPAAEERMRQAAEAWFEGDESLATLCEEALDPIAVELCNTLAGRVVGVLAEELASPRAGADLTVEMVRALDQAGLDLGAEARRAMATMAPAPASDLPVFGVDPLALPVRRNLWDVLLLRSRERVRRSLFGRDRARPVPARRKTVRLGPAARDALHAIIRRYTGEVLPAALRTAAERMAGGHREYVQRAVGERLAAIRTAETARKAVAERELSNTEALLEAIAELASAVANFEAGLRELPAVSLPAGAATAGVGTAT